MKINILKFLGFFSLIFCSNFVFAAGGQEGEAERQPRGLRLFVPAQPQDQVRVVRDLLGEQTAEITGDFRAYAVELNGSLAGLRRQLEDLQRQQLEGNAGLNDRIRQLETEIAGIQTNLEGMNEQLGTISQRLDRKFGDRIRNLGTRIRSSLPRFKPLPAVKWMWKNRKKVMYASLGACVAVKLLKRNFRRSRKPFTVLQPIYLPSSIAGPSGVKTSS